MILSHESFKRHCDRRCSNFSVLAVIFIVTLRNAMAIDILYPFYAYPGSSWISLANIAKSNSKKTFLLVLNVNHGPGIRMNALYAAGITRLVASPNVRLVGYIDTGYGNCFNWAKASAACTGKTSVNTISSVYSQMNSWVKFYGSKNLKGFYFNNFLPYGGTAKKSKTSISSVLKDYRSIYVYVKKTYPSYLVIGNPGLLDVQFKTAGVQPLADVLCVELAARSLLANTADKTKASFAHFPPGYKKALIVNKLVGTTAEANTQVSQLIGLAKKWGIHYFIAVRDYNVYPSDILPYLLKSLP